MNSLILFSMGRRWYKLVEVIKWNDCSAFIQKAFKEEFDLEMPRTTVSQAKISKEINKNELEVGDLVFQKQRENKPRWGLYDNGKFMHLLLKLGLLYLIYKMIFQKELLESTKRIID